MPSLKLRTNETITVEKIVYDTLAGKAGITESDKMVVLKRSSLFGTTESIRDARLPEFLDDDGAPRPSREPYRLYTRTPQDTAGETLRVIDPPFPEMAQRYLEAAPSQKACVRLEDGRYVTLRRIDVLSMRSAVGAYPAELITK